MSRLSTMIGMSVFWICAQVVASTEISEKYYHKLQDSSQNGHQPLLSLKEFQEKIEHYTRYHPSVSPSYLMSMINSQRHVIYLLESLLNDPKLLESAANMSRPHSLGFYKIVFLRSRVPGKSYEFRMHLKNNTPMDPFDEGIHNHFTECFAAYQVSGSTEHFIYPEYVLARAEEKSLYRKGQNALRKLKPALLKRVLFSLADIQHDQKINHPVYEKLMASALKNESLLSAREVATLLSLTIPEVTKLAKLQVMNEVKSLKKVKADGRTTRIIFEPKTLVRFMNPKFESLPAGTTYFMSGQNVYHKVFSSPDGEDQVASLILKGEFFNDAVVFNRMAGLAEKIDVKNKKRKLKYLNVEEFRKIIENYLNYLKGKFQATQLSAI